jgi:hypothetical protein
MQRVLSVTLSHALRAAAFVLLPSSFIALIAWATAGSASGSTTDPIRGAVWIWLGAHHIPFSISLPPSGIPGFFSYLPWGAIVIPFIALRITFNRALDRLQGDYHDINGVRMIFAIYYGAILTGLAFLSKTFSVHPEWYYAPLFGWFIAIIAVMTCGPRPAMSQAIQVATRLFSILLGLAFLVIGILIFTNFTVVKSISIVLDAGIFGGALLLLLNILYLPNIAIALLSYLAGSGFAVGRDTLISPWWHHMDQVPTFPLLGVVPVVRHPLAITLAMIFIGFGALLAYWTLDSGVNLLIQSAILFVAILLILSYLSSGSLMTDEMGTFGVSVWKFGLTATLEMALGAGMTTYLLSRAQR